MFDFVVQRHLSSDLSLEVLSSFHWSLLTCVEGYKAAATLSFWRLLSGPCVRSYTSRVSMLAFFHPSLSLTSLSALSLLTSSSIQDCFSALNSKNFSLSWLFQRFSKRQQGQLASTGIRSKPCSPISTSQKIYYINIVICLYFRLSCPAPMSNLKVVLNSSEEKLSTVFPYIKHEQDQYLQNFL